MFKLIISSIVLAVGLGELYVWWQSKVNFTGWISIAIAHALILGLMLSISSKTRLQFKLKRVYYWALVPAILVPIGAYLLSVSFPGMRDLPSIHKDLMFMIASMTIIPILEEGVFRGGVSRILQRVDKSVWSGYFSALVFSVAHTTPSVARLLDLQVGAPLGAFLLGIICEFMTRRTSSLVPAIAFHCACNSTVLIFKMWSPGWLDHLSMFYLW